MKIIIHIISFSNRKISYFFIKGYKLKTDYVKLNVYLEIKTQFWLVVQTQTIILIFVSNLPPGRPFSILLNPRRNYHD